MFAFIFCLTKETIHYIFYNQLLCMYLKKLAYITFHKNIFAV